MPGFLLHLGASVQCAHAGQAMPTVTNPRVTVSGQPIVNQPSPYTTPLMIIATQTRVTGM